MWSWVTFIWRFLFNCGTIIVSFITQQHICQCHLIVTSYSLCDPWVQEAQESQEILWNPKIWHRSTLFYPPRTHEQKKNFLMAQIVQLCDSLVIQEIQLLHCFLICLLLPMRGHIMWMLQMYLVAKYFTKWKYSHVRLYDNGQRDNSGSDWQTYIFTWFPWGPLRSPLARWTL